MQTGVPSGATIRDARESDLPRLLEIYSYYIEHTSISFDTEPLTLEQRRSWFEGFADHGRHRLLVAETKDGLAGYASSHAFRVKAAYRRSVETSIYLDPGAKGRGLGTFLYDRLLSALEAEPEVHRVLGGVTVPNQASIALHKRFGFEQVPRFSEVGFKFDQYWDVVWFERGV